MRTAAAGGPATDDAAAPLYAPLPGWRDPVDVLRAFAADPLPVLLLSGADGPVRSDNARWSFLCSAPFEVIGPDAAAEGDPIEALVAAVERHRLDPIEASPFVGGAVGFIGYDAAADGPPVSPGGPRLPVLQFGLYSWGVVWDHERTAWGVVATGRPERGRARLLKAREDLSRVAARAGGPLPPCPPTREPVAEGAPVLASSVPAERYLDMVTRARELIAEGEVYQVNLSQRLELPAPGDPVSLVAAMARHSAAPFSAYLDGGEWQVVSASPERFVSLRGRRAESRPIKGTAARGADEAEDRSLLASLIGSSKNRAENVMILDLIRNDLGRVCEPGSVAPTAICRPETYASVHHLVSIVTGVLAAGRTRADLLRAMHPGGSMTGAPKRRAMRAIAELEPVPRGLYAGALGYLSFCGGMDTSIVIRTAVVSGGRTWLHVGGGVVYDSDPEEEYRESLHKAASVRRALGACLSGNAG